MKKPLLFARELVAGVLKPGTLAVDATCGNGHDTVFMAGLVGETGRVLAMDIQEEAIIKTGERLAAAGLSERVTLIKANHAGMSQFMQGNVKAVMFNLGYLPGGDHSIVTRPQTSLAALKAALNALESGGMVTLAIYRGHAGGNDEYTVLSEYAALLPQQEFSVLEYRFINQRNDPPLLLAINRV
ncbi:MAG: methyltransferase domain-containing protein [Dethiobacter sp.]|nr:methyltransferase domain-containing protein [Dethiobacter sp.]